MRKSSPTQMVTVRVQVPTYSTSEALKKYAPAIVEAIENAEIFASMDKISQPIIRGASVGTVR